MKKRILAIIMLAVITSAITACQNNNKIDFVDYGFEEYTMPPTEKATEKPTEKVTEKPTQKSTQKATEKATQKATQKATEIVVNKKPTEKATEKPTQAPTQAEPQTEPETLAPTEPPTQPPTQAPTVPPVVTTIDDIKVIYNNYPLTLDADFNAVAGGFGFPDSKVASHRSTLTDTGEEYIYKYDNMTVHTYMKEGVERVESVQVDGIGKASTSKGIVVGNPSSYIKEMYGTPTSQDTVIIKYKVDNQFLIFYLTSDGTISGFNLVREK